MNKRFLMIGVFVLLVAVGLSGCQEEPKEYQPIVTGDTDKVALSNITIETFGSTNTSPSQLVKLGNGFFNNSTYFNKFYSIHGTMKNIAGDMIKTIKVIVKYYDKDHRYLINDSYTFYNTPASGSRNFDFSYRESIWYFDRVKNVEFQVHAI